MSARSPRLAALVAVGYLLGYLLVFVHFAAEQHAECAEHGGAHHVELVDDDGAPLAAGISALPVVADDHCHMLSAVRDSLSIAAAPAAPVIEANPRVHIEPSELNLPPPISRTVWRYAPKQSPPPSHA